MCVLKTLLICVLLLAPCAAQTPSPPYYTALELKAALPDSAQFKGYKRVHESYYQWDGLIPKDSLAPVARRATINFAEGVDGPDFFLSVGVVEDVAQAETGARSFHNSGRTHDPGSFTGQRIGTRCWNDEGSLLYATDGYFVASVSLGGSVFTQDDGKRIRLDPTEKDRVEAERLLKEVFERATALQLTTRPAASVSTRTKQQVADRLKALRAEQAAKNAAKPQ